MSDLDAIRDRVVTMTATPEFADWLTRLLVRLGAVDTSPNPDVAVAARREAEVFALIEQELAGAGGRAEYRCLDPAIERSPHFSNLYYTQTPANPSGLNAAEAYRERRNLLYFLDGAGYAPERGRRAAVNAHIDVVKPYIPPRVEGPVVYGRGCCDDKNSVAAMVAALRLLSDLRREKLVRLNQALTFMFVIEEETGGNGSLALALDPELRQRYDSILVLECTGNRLHPANRGAVWYRTALHTQAVSKLEAAAWCILEVEDEGARIKAESNHPLFPQRPVQTCHGILQQFGEHPSRINGEVAFVAEGTGLDRATVERVAAPAVSDYVARYGDKTKVINPDTGKPKVARHLDLVERPGAVEVRVWGATGHMGSILENDGAITKMAYVVRALVEARGQSCPADLRLRVVGDELTGDLNLEGGQGFVPTHSLDQVTQRVRAACDRGLASYLQRLGQSDPDAHATTTFAKLHNAAFDGDPDSPSMRHGIAAMRAAGLWAEGETIQGWTVSCDARLFAVLHPGLSVLTTGAGSLVYAHSDREQIRIPDLVQSVRMLLLYLLLETGSL